MRVIANECKVKPDGGGHHVGRAVWKTRPTQKKTGREGKGKNPGGEKFSSVEIFRCYDTQVEIAPLWAVKVTTVFPNKGVGKADGSPLDKTLGRLHLTHQVTLVWHSSQPSQTSHAA